VTVLEAALQRDRLLILGGLGLATAAVWSWLIPASLDMYGAMDGLAAWMMQDRWDLHYFVLIFAMWAAMMVGMMLPSAAPTLLLYGVVLRRSPDANAAVSRVYAFAAGYLLIWTAFSIAATLLQWLLSRSTLMTPMMEAASSTLGGALLIVAGIYQWSPLKRACLAYCRAPAGFISRHWSPGHRGALRMGLRHGAYCLGCCWVLMLLLFVGGVMNLWWIAAITIFVLLEKIAPWGAQGGRLSGIALLIFGGWLLLQS
jgi:predicted metal-binding membrane protein